MKKPELTKEENDLYLKIVKSGNADDMFELGYLIGRERFAKEQLDSPTYISPDNMISYSEDCCYCNIKLPEEKEKFDWHLSGHKN